MQDANGEGARMGLSNTLFVEGQEREGPSGLRNAEADVSAGTLRRARAGDPRAFKELFAHYDRRLRALASRVLRDPQAMDDALQEAAIKAFRALPQFRGDSSLGTWLYRITYTTCLNYLRDHGPIPGIGSDDDGGRSAGLDDPSELAVADLDLRDTLLRLTPQQRVAVLLVIQQGYDVRTAAEILGIPAGTMASRLAAARAALRRALSARPGEGGTT